MQRTNKGKRAKRGPWAQYNTWRARNRPLDNARRRERAAQRRAEREAQLNALAATLQALPPAPKPKPGLKLLIRIDVRWAKDRESHSFTAAWCPVFQRWSVPQRRIVKGVTALMQRATVIAGLKREET